MTQHDSIAGADGSSFTIQDQARMARAKNYLAWQSRLILPELGQRVVEVGCGMGNFTEYLLGRDQVIAVDVEPECVKHLRQRYPARSNLLVFACEPTNPAFAELSTFRPDSCVCTNVLEHIPDDAAALRAMAAILEPQGKIVLWVPAFQALYGSMDKRLDHCRRYRKQDMLRLAAQVGLKISKMRYVNMAGFFLWWASSRLIRQQAVTGTQIDIFDRLIAPWLSRLEAMVQPPFGQSLFAVLQKH